MANCVETLDERILLQLSRLEPNSTTEKRILIISPLKAHEICSELTAFRCVLTLSNFVNVLQRQGHTCWVYGIENSFNIELPHFSNLNMAEVESCDVELEKLKILALENACNCGAEFCIDMKKITSDLEEKILQFSDHCVVKENSNSGYKAECIFAAFVVSFCKLRNISDVAAIFAESSQHFSGKVRILSGLLNSKIKFTQLSVGIVKSCLKIDLNCPSFFEIRKRQVTNAYKRKHTLTEITDNAINSLLWACVSFEFLTKACNKPLLLINLSDEDLLPDTAVCGLKVVYCYARICSIIGKFNDFVEKGVYESLIPLHDLDGNVKIKVFDSTKHLLDCLRQQNVNLGKFLPGCGRLIDFTRQFSKFYRKFQVLVDPSPSLMGSMHAKVHVLLCLEKCLVYDFCNLCIDPVQRM